MKKKLILTFQIAAVFIGTIVGAGLASGQEISQFFTVYGPKSFIGIIICCFIYIIIGTMIINVSIKYNLKSYTSIINLVSPNFLGQATYFVTAFFFICSSAIILAGSGSLINQYFKISKWFGILSMLALSIIVLLRNTKGLIGINSFIVPSLIIIISTVFILYIKFGIRSSNCIAIQCIKGYKKNWLMSALIYGAFNIFCCSGVLVPLSSEINRKSVLKVGLILGAIGLTVLSMMLNFMLLLNIPYIFKYDIPLMYIAERFSKILQILLLIIIWFEMFSTEISDVYSIAKTSEEKFKISYKNSVFIILGAAIPISQIGFVKLIKFIYPAFAVISFIFIIQFSLFYIKNMY